MTVALYFPLDEATPDIGADYLELTSFFSRDNQAFTSDIINASEIGAEEDYGDVDAEINQREEIRSQVIRCIGDRKTALGDCYPFKLDAQGDLLIYQKDSIEIGQAAYLLSLILSHLKSVSPILSGSSVYPHEDEVRKLREYFQYFATAALAAEIGGQAWSFGHPRPDHTGFFTKLKEIWGVLKDGMVDPDPSAPIHPQDDQVDIFAWKGHPDGLPGFYLQELKWQQVQIGRRNLLRGTLPTYFGKDGLADSRYRSLFVIILFHLQGQIVSFGMMC